jgi:hypothetical protein
MLSIRLALSLALLVALAGCDGGGGGDGGGGDGGDGGVDDTGAGCETPLTSCPGAGCVNTSSNADHCGDCATACSGCDLCILGSCTPACCASEVDCDPSPSTVHCIDTEFDRANCGSCDNACADDEICYRRACERCEPPEARCGNNCADLSDDIRNCGECGTACERMYCQCGECVAERTDAGCE